MAALEAATQRRASARVKGVFAIADAIGLGGRVKPGHDELDGSSTFAQADEPV
jgi:hypothetical protein